MWPGMPDILSRPIGAIGFPIGVLTLLLVISIFSPTETKTTAPVTETQKATKPADDIQKNNSVAQIKTDTTKAKKDEHKGPSDDFFQGTFASGHNMGSVEVSNDARPLADFFKKKTMEWEKISDTQWIAKLKNEDPLTKKTNEISILFSREKRNEKGETFLLMSRASHNGVEASPSEVSSLANMIYMSAIGLGQ
jgi:hypothetical protein